MFVQRTIAALYRSLFPLTLRGRKALPYCNRCRPAFEILEDRVVPSNNAQLSSLSVPSGGSIAPGAFTETVTMTNTGTTTWTNGVNGDTLNRNPQGTDPFQQGSVYYAT